MPEAIYVRDGNQRLIAAPASVDAGQVTQTADGRAVVYDSQKAAASGQRITLTSEGQYTMPKNTSTVLLDGAPCYWDYSAGEVTYRKVNDRDFFLGSVVGDYGAGDAAVIVALNVQPTYLIDLARDAFATVITGTQALNGLALLRRGGAHHFVLSSTSEAQKLDALSIDGFSKDANAIVEGAFRVVSDGAGTAVDVSIGLANATHATDADSITESLFVHLDANDVDINLESDDGTTEVAATDSTIDYTEGSSLSERVEFWFDLRDPADIQCYINGALVLGATTFSLNAATGPLKLLCHIEKTSSTDTYELALDWLRARISEL